MDLVEEAIRNWEAYRKGVIAELENIPEEHWDYQPGPGARTLRELARHIVEATVAFTDEVLRPDGSFARFFDPQFRSQLRAALPAETKAEIIDLLRSTGERDTARLREAGEKLASEAMKSRGGEQSRLTALWFAIAHEAYHRGQLATYARGVGLEPAMTQQIRSKTAR